ncbi:MAG: hypothetical protein JJ900_11705 [Rhodospirillales bacterium]|nr:hypothetical protein [Rhodospirillales bacterium]MBO6787506.1 hypothetical protein [Rhodospirillales bacterium]
MVHINIDKSNFTGGEISPRLLGRGDLRTYANGAGKLRNVFIHPTGGVTRRPGLRYVDTARGAGRLVAFEFNTEQVYLLAFTDGHLDVYKDGEQVADFATPWTEAQVAEIKWVQSADTLFVVHPDIEPRKITRTSHTDWAIDTWTFLEKDDRIQQPHHKFADEAITLTPSTTSGSITLTASADAFDAGHVGGRLRIGNKEVEITAVASATSATATVKETLSGTAATKDWEEQAFSSYRGWPSSVCFHQDRLVIGGSRDLPNRLWISKSADLFNFDLGEGLDDEAIEFAILSDQVNAIRAVFSGRHLQVFTSGAEWMVTGEPLTPQNLQLKRQTRIGSPVDRSVPPRDVDGATIFVPRDGSGIREFLFADVEQAYQATDLATTAQHLINAPVDQDYDNAGRLLHVVMGDGTLGTLTVYRAEKVNAWSVQTTAGSFLSVAIVGGDTYLLIERDEDVLIERFDDILSTDSAIAATQETATDTWAGYSHLEGRTLSVLADGSPRDDASVSSGEITLVYDASKVEAGLAYEHIVEPMPPILSAVNSGLGTKVRPISVTLRLQNTAALSLDVGRGYKAIPFQSLGASLLDQPVTTFTGDKTVRALGWRTVGPEPMWSVRQDVPLPFTLLSVATKISANG